MEKLRLTDAEQQYAEAKKWYAQEFGAATETESILLPDMYGKDDSDNNRKIEKSKNRKIEKYNLKTSKSKNRKIENPQHLSTITPFVAAFGFTLGNFTNDLQALFAITHDGQTIPAYIDFSKIKTVSELIHLTNTQMLTAYEKSQYPFEECCNDLGLNIQTCFEFGSQSQQSESVSNLQLAMNVYQDNDGTYKCQVEYNSNKYSDEIIAQLCQTYDNVLCQMLALSEVEGLALSEVEGLALSEVEGLAKTNLSDIELLNKSQLEQVCSFNHSDDNLFLSNYRNVVSAFRDIARKYPDNTAVEYKDYKISYREFDKLTDQIASMIVEHIGNSPEQSIGVGLPVVSILIGRSENIAIMPVAALKAGAAYQPLDPSYPEERLNFMVKDSGAQLVITDRNLRPLLNEYEGDVLFTEDIVNSVAQTAIDKNTLQQAEEKLNEASAFSLLYTSGSTGVPKGVILEHGNLLTFCSYNYKHIHLSQESKIAAYASFGFDANMMDIFSALTSGASLVIVPEEIRLDLDEISNYFADHDVTHVMLTTQVAYQFATIFPEHPTLKVLIAGGEKLATLEPPLYQLYNIYGPTETTVYATSKIVEHKETNIPIGLSNTTAPCMIVNKYGKRLPVGAAGELIITGKQVGRGYLNQPDRTAEVFGVFGEHSYKTGDVVRYRENGDIEFIGRKDGQVKIRGFRVELKEVESVIREFEGIKDATVQAFDLDSGGKYIAAYIVSGSQIDIQAMNDFIASQKPPYMVPAVTMQIDAIPLNVNQKVDKKKLPKPEVKHPESNEGNMPVRELNILEKQLVEITEQLIGNTPDIATPLTHCGLSSILSMRLAAKINKQYGFKFSIKELMGGATILTIENAILNQFISRLGSNPTNLKTSKPQNLKTVSTSQLSSLTSQLSFSQQGVYLDCQAQPDTLIYNLPMEVKFPASVDTDKLAEATKAVLESHPILFAHFSEDDQGNTIQTLDAEKTAEVTIELAESDNDYEELKKAFLRPFNLKTDRLFRAKVIHLQSSNEKILLIDIHHLVCDGGSVEIMINQIISALKGSAIENETYTYLDFCADQRRFAESQEFLEHKEFFSQQLKDFDAVTEILPNVSTSEPGKPKEVAISIPSILTSNLSPLTSNNGVYVTEAEFWLAATAYALGRFSNSRDVYFSTVSSGRQNLDIADTVGMFVNTLPISAHIKDQTVGEFIQEVAKTFKDTTDHENYPFSHIAGDYGYKAGITYAYQLGLIGDNTIDGKEILWNQFGLDKPMFRIAIFIEMYNGKPSIVLQYDDSLYSESLIRSLTESIVSAACNMVANLDLPVKKLSLMTPAATAEICNIGKGEELDYDQNLTIPDILRRQAQLTPDAVAVVFHDKELTYRQLDDVTESMACTLQSLGVGRETVTGIMIDRSELMVIFPMAVMKAGGAYMPLDPEFPEDRLLFMCEDANVNLILTSDGLAQKIMPNYKGRIINDNDNLEISKSRNLTNPQPTNLMVVLYTSGSTGKPKGVLLEQRSIVNFCHWYVKNCNMTSNDSTIAYANFGFDAHMLDLYPTFLAGATVHILDTDIRHDLVAMSEYINKHKLTISFMTTQIGCQMVSLFDMPSIRCFSVGGEKMPHITTPAYNFYNLYGPTECSVASTCNKVTEHSSDGKIIGKPLANYQLYVVDADKNILPAGAAGELLVEGRCVARGYLNRPDVNAEKFIIINDNDNLEPSTLNPVGESVEPQPSTLAYRTGDQVRWTADGNIEYIGRMDGQVKLRGLRIELGEVETMMTRFPAIRLAAAAVRDVAGSQHLCGYFTVKEGMTVSEDELKEFMRQSLTDFMIPDFFVLLDTMPLTPNGKIDKKKLPIPDSNSVQDYVEPRNDVERFFCEVVAKTLNLERVGITDNFFQIGGTSLIAMRLAVAISKGGYNMVYKDLFDHPTPEDMARFVTGTQISDPSTSSGQAQNDTTITGYDYSRINHIVSNNNIGTYLSDTSQHTLGTVFLTGATGYLGIHVLHELLENPDIPAIYCLVRGSKNYAALSRLQTLLYYYFDNTYKDLVGKRLFIIEGDVTKPFDYVNVHIDTVINCAANVKHFSAGTDIEDINIGGTINCIDLCLRTGARFIHTSTGSVGGLTVSDDKNVTPHILLEKELWFGQDLDNKYVLSKFIAERKVLEAIAEKGLKAKIMRMGNLGPRSTDGEFQVNFHSNAFMGQLKGFQTLQAIPYSAMPTQAEFSPIDDAARAICLLSTTNDNCTIYHAINSHRPLYMDIIKCINKIGFTIRPIDNQAFEAILQDALQDNNKADILQSMLAYSTRSDGKTCVENTYASDYTTQVLLHLGFQWDMTTWDYIEQFLLKIQSLGFFDEDYVR